MIDGVDRLRVVHTDAAQLLAQADNVGEAKRLLTMWAKSKDHLNAISGSLFRPMVQADMGGQLFVREVELPSKSKKFRRESRQIKLAFEDAEAAFLQMPFDEAVAYFERRFGSSARAADIIRKYRERADAAALRALEETAARIVDRIGTHLEEGLDLESFVSEFASKGFEPSYLQTVYRTNVSTAYGAGRVRELEEVADFIPYVEYRTAGDSAVRPAHAELDGKQWRNDDPEWKRYAPPNGFNCRCSMVSADEEDVDQSQLERRVTTSPDKGFDKSPDELIEQTL